MYVHVCAVINIIIFHIITWKYVTPCKKGPSGTNSKQRHGLACPSVQSDQGLHCPLIESLDTTECMNGEQRPRWYFAHVQDDLNLHFAPLKVLFPLRKHAYSNILKILPPKNVTFQIKKSDIFHISAQNKDCGYSLEPPGTIYVFEQK